MIITVDSNVLLSIFIKDTIYQQSSRLLEKYSSNEFIINDCIYLELGVNFRNFKKLDDALNILEVNVIKKHEIDFNTILHAWISYLSKKKFICPSCKKIIHPICPKCKRPQSFRQRILTDFLIGGFALINSNGIITLDPAYYKNYFPELTIFN
jgi:predicted nucleic acid-binding protein